jgi:hypothetical protein
MSTRITAKAIRTITAEDIATDSVTTNDTRTALAEAIPTALAAGSGPGRAIAARMASKVSVSFWRSRR